MKKVVIVSLNDKYNYHIMHSIVLVVVIFLSISIMLAYSYNHCRRRIVNYAQMRKQLAFIRLDHVDSNTHRCYVTTSGELPEIVKKVTMKRVKELSVSSMTEDMARVELIKLNNEINMHDVSYYDNDAPSISDGSYDKLVRRAEAIIGKYSTLRDAIDKFARVGSGKRSNKFYAFNHSRPMLSLDNAYDEDDVRAFLDRVNKTLNTTKSTANNSIDSIEDDSVSIEYVLEPKIDGLSLALRYTDGVLTAAGTRGDGNVGEDVTNNVKFIKGIPLALPTKATIEVRGEVYISKDDFHQLNCKRKQNNETVFSSARNAAAGSIRQLNETVASGRNLQFFAYYLHIAKEDDACGIIRDNTPAVPTDQVLTLSALEEMNFAVSKPYQLCLTEEDIFKYYNMMQDNRSGIPYDADGVVIKVNSYRLQDALGFRSRYPKWAIAYKFTAEEAITKLHSIDVQVGRTGVLTPIANLAPVQLNGVTIQRATLHNFYELSRLKLFPGCTVKVKRAGDVIPKIIGLADAASASASASDSDSGDDASMNDTLVQIPTKCPVCGSAVEKDGGIDGTGVLIRCTGGTFLCSAQTIEGIRHFCSRDAIDIDGLGPAKIQELYDMQLLKTIADIYRFRSADITRTVATNSSTGPGATASLSSLREKKGWGDRSVNNLLASIDRRRRIPFHRFLFALGVRHVGLETAKDIAANFVSFKSLWKYLKDEAVRRTDISTGSRTDSYISTEGDCESSITASILPIGNKILCIKGIGSKALDSLLKVASDVNSVNVIEALFDEVVVDDDASAKDKEAMLLSNDDASAVRLPLTGQSVVFTGKLLSSSREDMKKKVLQLGGVVATTVRKATILVCGITTSDTSKLKVATENNVKIYTEDEWIAYIDVDKQ